MKITELQSYLEYHNIHLAFLTNSDPNLVYFTQMEPSHGFLLITPDKANLLISKLDKKPKIKGIKTNYVNKSWKKDIQDECISRIGINKRNLTVAMMDNLLEIES